LCLLVMLCAFLGYAARSFIALQVQKRRAGVCSGQTCRLPTRCASLRWAGAKAACRGVLPACGIWRRAAAFCDGQEQKPPAGVCSGLRHRLPTRCGVLRRAGAKATCRGALRPAAASTDRLRLSAMGRGKSHLLGCAPASRAVCRQAAPPYDGQGQKPPAGVIFGQRQRLPTGCAAPRWAGAKATRRGDLRPAAPSADTLRRSAMGRGKSGLPGCAPARRAVYRPAAPLCDGQGQKPPAGVRSGQRHRLPTGCGICRRAAAFYDGQE
jgi:hypothetical protein